MKKSKISLSIGKYSEEELVNLVCSGNLLKRYLENGAFKGGTYKRQFLDKLGRLCDFEAGSAWKPYIINKVYDVPVTEAEEKLGRGVYSFLAPRILSMVRRDPKERQLATAWELAEATGLVNSNYIFLKSRPSDVAEALGILREDVSEFCLRTDAPMKRYVSKCLDYLVQTKALKCREVTLISSWSDELTLTEDQQVTILRTHSKHKATPKEETRLKEITQFVEQKVGIRDQKEKGYGYKAQQYSRELKRALAAERISSYQRGYEFWCGNLEVCGTVLARLGRNTPDENAFPAQLMKTAQRRASQTEDPEGYMDAYALLLQTSVLSGAENLSHSLLPSRKRKTDPVMAVYADVYQGYQRRAAV